MDGRLTDNQLLQSMIRTINDEETYLTRRQRVTLSQFRSGHCKLLNSYKKRLKPTDSSSCPDCGMDLGCCMLFVSYVWVCGVVGVWSVVIFVLSVMCVVGGVPL